MQITDYSQPTPLVKDTFAAITPGQVLDVGSYAGRNALYLARLGWKVTAVDTDTDALDVLRATNAKENLGITAQSTDIRRYQPIGQFDAVLCLMVLHFLPEQAILPTINKMQE